MTEYNRPNWDTYFMDVAEVVSERASCPRASVGAVIVRGNRIITTGYNGAPPGQPECVEVGCHMSEGHCRRAVHAEANAIFTAARYGIALEGATLYVTHTPCDNCRMIILSVGIARTLNRNAYAGEQFLERTNGD